MIRITLSDKQREELQSHIDKYGRLGRLTLPKQITTMNDGLKTIHKGDVKGK